MTNIHESLDLCVRKLELAKCSLNDSLRCLPNGIRTNCYEMSWSLIHPIPPIIPLLPYLVTF
ncbi:hypothetical protein D3C85_1747730 [compost metagenome]